MEKNTKLIKDAKPGEMPIRTSITRPDVTGPVTDRRQPVGPNDDPRLPLEGPEPQRRPFSDD